MKRDFLFMMCAIAMVAAVSGGCKSKQSASETVTEQVGNNGQIASSWTGTYVGVLPCADCPGIETKVTISPDGKFVLLQKYLDKDENYFKTEGTVKAGDGKISLQDEQNRLVANYSLQRNDLKQLDMEGNAITGELAPNYLLAKVDPLLVGHRWKLTELNGAPVTNDAYLILDTEDNRISGNLSCNTFSGVYELKPGNRIRITNVVATQKMCLNNMEVETELKKVLGLLDSYTISDSTLVFSRARMAPLAKFLTPNP